MDKKIEKVYKEFRFLPGKMTIAMVCSIIILSLCVSVFLGSPFPYKEEIAFFTLWQNGWLVDKEYIIYIIIVISAIAALVWEIWRVKRVITQFTDILYKKCDAEALLEISKYGISYVPNRLYKNAGKADRKRKTVIIYFERFYVEALNAKGRYAESLEYLEQHWESNRNAKVYVLLWQNVKLNLACEQGNKEEYQKIFMSAVPAIKQNKLMAAQKLYMEENYKGAIELLENMKVQVCYEKVCQSYKLAECYMKQKKYDEAKECIKFVQEYGNTSVMKEKALAMEEQMEN